MRIENPNVETFYDYDYLESIERAARICYASESKGNAQEFVDRLKKANHGRPLEFGTIYLVIPNEEKELVNFFENNRYSRILYTNEKSFVTTNYRVLFENKKLSDRCDKYIVSIHGYNNRITQKWTISRGIADEFRTHTMISSLMQSTRYCNYSKDKFGSQITFIRPTWFNDRSAKWRRRVMKLSWWMTEKFYLLLIKMGSKPQEARDILPLGIKTEFIQCAFKEDWDEFYRQRCDSKAHPDAIFIAKKSKLNTI